MRRRLLALTMLAVASGCTTPAASPSTVPAPSVSAAPAVPSPTPTLVVGDVTPARVLQVADGGRDPLGYGAMRDEFIATVRPPCATAAGASEALIVKRATATMSYRFSPPPSDSFDGDVDEVLTRYQNDGAARLVAEWWAGVAACPHEQVGQNTRDHTVLGTGFAGNESILISTVSSGPGPGPPGITFSATHYTAIIRIGDAAIVLRVFGWEGTSAKPEDAERLVQAAVARATA